MLRLVLALIVVLSSQCVAACAVVPPAHCHGDASPSCDRGAEQETAVVVDVAPSMIAVLFDDSGVSVFAVERAVVRLYERPKPPLRI